MKNLFDLIIFNVFIISATCLFTRCIIPLINDIHKKSNTFEELIEKVENLKKELHELVITISFIFILIFIKTKSKEFIEVGPILLACTLLTFMFIENVFFDEEEFLCKTLPLKYFMKGEIQYLFSGEKTIEFKVKKILVDDIVIETNSTEYIKYIRILIKYLPQEKKIVLEGHIAKEDRTTWIELNKERVLRLLIENEKENQKLCDIKWKMKLSAYTILIRNSYMSNHYLRFAIKKSDIRIMDKIVSLPKEMVTSLILMRKSSYEKIAEKLGTDEIWIVDNFYDSNYKNYNWQPIDSYPHSSDKDNQTKEDKSQINPGNTISTLVSEIDSLLDNGFMFKTISKEQWENYYRKELLSEKRERKAIVSLSALKNDMYDQKESKTNQERDLAIEVLQNKLKLDGVENIGSPPQK